MKIPSTNPSAMAGTASRSVPPMNGPIPISPCSIRNLKLATTTEKSTSALPRRISRRSSAGSDAGDEAGDRVAALHARHDGRNGQAQHQVDDGAGRERLDRLGSVGLDLARLERQLGDADGQGNRGVLEEIERLVGARRHDQAEGD